MFALRTPRSAARRPAFRPRCEALEDRLAPATFTVTDTGDTSCQPPAAVTLRCAIQQANANPGPDRIDLTLPGDPNAVVTIQPLTYLAFGLSDVTIDGYTQGNATPNSLAIGNNAKLRVEVDGSLCTDCQAALSITYRVTVKGLVIN